MSLQETVLVIEVNREWGKVVINVLESDIPKVNTANNFNALIENLDKYLALDNNESCTILNIFKY